MLKFLTVPALAVVVAVSGSSFAQASEELKDAVRPFYEKLLSAPSSKDMPTQAEKTVVENWVSIPTPRGGKGREGLVKTLKGFGKAVPDLKWEIQEMLVDGNRVIVRSIATGTPAKPFFGVTPKGLSFKIMTIDIHTVENGKIVKSYHVEDWARAIRQVAGKTKK